MQGHDHRGRRSGAVARGHVEPVGAPLAAVEQRTHLHVGIVARLGGGEPRSEQPQDSGDRQGAEVGRPDAHGGHPDRGLALDRRTSSPARRLKGDACAGAGVVDAAGTAGSGTPRRRGRSARGASAPRDADAGPDHDLARLAQRQFERPPVERGAVQSPVDRQRLAELGGAGAERGEVRDPAPLAHAVDRPSVGSSARTSTALPGRAASQTTLKHQCRP